MLGKLTTEANNDSSANIDSLSARDIVGVINQEDQTVAVAVSRVLEPIAQAVELIARTLRQGGRLIYLGAGTSGRLGVLDASECPPTFNTDPGQVVGVIAGGSEALVRSIEGAEDSPDQAAEDLTRLGLSNRDVLVGIATSGRTPYVLGGLEFAAQVGARRVGLACNSESQLRSKVDVMIEVIVGPEVIAGSTRMKAGSATKMVLNMLSTAAMICLGKTYRNWMVDLKATNSKLVDRTQRILISLTGVGKEAAAQLLAECNGELKTAIVVQSRGVSAAEARRLLAANQGRLRPIIEGHSANGAKE